MQKRILSKKLEEPNIPKLKEISISMKRTVSQDYQTLSLGASETFMVDDTCTDIPALRRKLFNILVNEIDTIINEDLSIDIHPGK